MVAASGNVRRLTDPVVRAWHRVEPLHGVVAFVAGFAWDSATLRRIDRLSDNLLLLAYLALLGALLALDDRLAADPPTGAGPGLRSPAVPSEASGGAEPPPDRSPPSGTAGDRPVSGCWPRLARRKGWVEWLVQFLFGGLYSAYVVFYSKSASEGRTFVFLVALGALMVANEFAHDVLKGERLRLALYWLCAFSFLLFFVPVVTGFPGPGIFSMAVVGATALSSAVVAAMSPRGPLRSRLVRHAPAWGGVALVLVLLDVLGVIPPVPLALMGGGLFHQVVRDGHDYALTYEDPGFWHPFTHDDRRFRLRPGDRAFCFSAIFAPTGMALAVVHVWERWDADQGWQVADRIPFQVEGGRDGGYRGYTAKRHLDPGDWRVRVETDDGRELGRYRFTVEEADGDDVPEYRVRVYE